VIRPADFLELVRAPAALTVLGDALVGALGAGHRPGGRTVALAVSSTCLYTAGMALNDFADAELDARERPERPIPSGRVSRGTAFGVGAALTAVGIGSAFTAGRASGLVSLALAAALWSYDLVFKSTPAGPLVMAACRGLDVLMGGAGAGWRGAIVPAAGIAAHTVAVTAVSRGEVNGTSTAVGRFAAASSVFAAGSAAAWAPSPAGALVGGAKYLGAVLPGQLAVAESPTAANARSATRDGIRAVVPLQAAFAARAAAPVSTAFLLGIEALGKLLGRSRRNGDIT
jgi:4-hydroxybenzoate polyprenyltransferase